MTSIVFVARQITHVSMGVLLEKSDKIQWKSEVSLGGCQQPLEQLEEHQLLL